MFSQRLLRCWYCLGLLALILGATPAQAAIPPYIPPPTVQLGGSGGPVKTDGKTVIWSTNDNAEGELGGIEAMSLSNGQRSMVVEHRRGLGHKNPFFEDVFYTISDGVVLWLEGPSNATSKSIRIKRIGTSDEVELASGYVRSPALIGDTAYWWQHNEIYQPITLMARNVRTLEPARAILHTSHTLYGLGPVHSDGVRLVWVKGVGQTRPAGVFWDIMVLDPGATTARVLVKDLLRGIRFDIAVTLNYVVYGAKLAVHRVNLTTGQATVLVNEVIVDHITGTPRYLFWDESLPRPNGGVSDPHLGGYDLVTGSHFTIAPGEISRVYGPQVSGSYLIWRTGNPLNATTLHFQQIIELLPSGYRAAPNPPQPGRLYFPESGHTLGHERFLAFWEGSGGLPVFGLPLTEEFRQINADTSKLYLTQYFERQRFEHHPENAGTPYEVLLGRLGAEMLTLQGRNWHALPKASPTTPHYFAETGHAIAPVFWDYWRSQGLEFGHPGVSEAEALALFGYPLSEPELAQNSSGDLVLTQWFERARFEYHPNNPAPHKVLLGRLAAELLVLQDWR